MSIFHRKVDFNGNSISFEARIIEESHLDKNSSDNDIILEVIANNTFLKLFNDDLKNKVQNFVPEKIGHEALIVKANPNIEDIDTGGAGCIPNPITRWNSNSWEVLSKINPFDNDKFYVPFIAAIHGCNGVVRPSEKHCDLIFFVTNNEEEIERMNNYINENGVLTIYGGIDNYSMRNGVIIVTKLFLSREDHTNKIEFGN